MDGCRHESRHPGEPGLPRGSEQLGGPWSRFLRAPVRHVTVQNPSFADVRVSDSGAWTEQGGVAPGWNGKGWRTLRSAVTGCPAASPVTKAVLDQGPPTFGLLTVLWATHSSRQRLSPTGRPALNAELGSYPGICRQLSTRCSPCCTSVGTSDINNKFSRGRSREVDRCRRPSRHTCPEGQVSCRRALPHSWSRAAGPCHAGCCRSR